MSIFFCGITPLWADVIDVVNYGGFESPAKGMALGDFYLGQIHLDNANKKLWFSPVVTDDKAGSGYILKLWQKWLGNSPRVYVDAESKIINARLKEFKQKGLCCKDDEGNKQVILIGSLEFPQALRQNIAERWGIVNSEIGTKYFKNGWSESRNDELRHNREYYDFEYPFQKMSQEEYYKKLGKIK